MRDRRFIAEHRGGPLTKEQHHRLAEWAIVCVNHIMHLGGEDIDHRLLNALDVAHRWAQGTASVGDARNASLQAIAVANETDDAIYKLLARAVGHAVATAHMADHALRAAQYALKAVKSAGKSESMEQKWQEDQLPHEVRDLVITAR